MRSKKNPETLLQTVSDELLRRPYDAVALRTKQRALVRLGRHEEAAVVGLRLDEIKGVLKNHRHEPLDFDKARESFLSHAGNADYVAAANVLVRLGRNLQLPPTHMNRLLQEVREAYPEAIDGLVGVLAGKETSMDIGELCALGYVYRHARKRSAALRVFKIGASLFERHVPIRFALYLMTAGENPSSMRMAWILHRLQPGNPTAAQLLAAAYLRFGHADFAIRTLHPFYVENNESERTRRLLGLAYIKIGDFDTARDVLGDVGDGGLREVKMAQAFMSGDDKTAATIAAQIIQGKFDAYAVAVFAISNGLAGRWLHQSMAANVMPGIEPEQFADVSNKIRMLQKDRGVFLESLIIQEWQDLVAPKGARISSIYEDTDMQPLTRAATNDVYHPRSSGRDSFRP